MADIQPWYYVIAAGVPPLLIAWLGKYYESAEKKAERRQTADARLRDSFTEAQVAAFARAEADIARERTRREALEVEVDRVKRAMQAEIDRLNGLLDRAWDIARAWRIRARELRHDLLGARQSILGLKPDTKPEDFPAVPPLPELEKIET